MSFGFFRQTHQAANIAALYGAIVAQARSPAFYAAYGVPDTVQGRFDMIVLHLVLLIRRLRREGEGARALGQQVFDAFCTDLDHNLREMGTSDTGVPREMRRFGEAFYGRAAAYDAALDQADDAALTAALVRNVLGAAEIGDAAHRLARYVRACERELGGQQPAAFAAGEVRFPSVPDERSASLSEQEAVP